MPKATDKNITTRRTFLSMVSAGIAAGATFIAAAPALALPADPIFAAIAVHLLTAEGDGPFGLEYAEMNRRDHSSQGPGRAGLDRHGTDDACRPTYVRSRLICARTATLESFPRDRALGL
jgi:hypothetical protein